MPQPEPNWLTAAAGKRLLGLPVPELAIILGLLLSVLVVYAQVGQFDFIRMDDDMYVSQNAGVRAGLTPASIVWALTAVASSNSASCPEMTRNVSAL